MLGLDENGELTYYCKDNDEENYMLLLENLVNLLRQNHKNGRTYVIPVEVFDGLFDKLNEIKEKLSTEYYIGYVEHNDKVIDEILEMLKEI